MNETTAPKPAIDAPQSEAASPAPEKKPVLKRPRKGGKAKSASKPARKPKALTASKPPAIKDITTLDDLCTAFIAHLARAKSPGTARSYTADLAVARKHFGDDCKVKTLTVKKVAAYFASERVMKTRAGVDKNPVTLAKIRRVFRQMLVWAADKGVIEEAPLPEPTK